MNVRLLIDSIVRQTTVLIAQLSTTAGVRAPLAHLADHVFLSLSREIEAQGVGRKVAADMFGLALRSYQKKTRRLAESRTSQGKTLFEAVLGFIDKERGSSRAAVIERFSRDGERETIAVLADLVQSGLVYSTGSGPSTLYGVTSEAERQRLTRDSDTTALCEMALGAIYRNPGITVSAVCAELDTSEADLDKAIGRLEKEGRVTRDASTGLLRASTFQIPVDAEHGWESAVFDHFQALATAVANKLTLRSQRHPASRYVGGTTLGFELSKEHPLEHEVLGLLQRFRDQTDELWQRVAEHNDAHPLRDDQRYKVSFYFGQNIDDPALISAREADTHHIGEDP